MTDDYMFDKVLDKIEMVIGIQKFDDAKILINTDDKLFEGVTLKNIVVLNSFVKKKNGGKFYQQIFLEEAKVA